MVKSGILRSVENFLNEVQLDLLATPKTDV